MVKEGEEGDIAGADSTVGCRKGFATTIEPVLGCRGPGGTTGVAAVIGCRAGGASPNLAYHSSSTAYPRSAKQDSALWFRTDFVMATPRKPPVQSTHASYRPMRHARMSSSVAFSVRSTGLDTCDPSRAAL